MEATKTYKRRSREEIMAWLQRARDRKEAFQRETDEWWQNRQRNLREAEESGYYKLDWWK